MIPFNNQYDALRALLYAIEQDDLQGRYRCNGYLKCYHWYCEHCFEQGERIEFTAPKLSASLKEVTHSVFVCENCGRPVKSGYFPEGVRNADDCVKFETK